MALGTKKWTNIPFSGVKLKNQLGPIDAREIKCTLALEELALIFFLFHLNISITYIESGRVFIGTVYIFQLKLPFAVGLLFFFLLTRRQRQIHALSVCLHRINCYLRYVRRGRGT